MYRFSLARRAFNRDSQQFVCPYHAANLEVEDDGVYCPRNHHPHIMIRPLAAGCRDVMYPPMSLTLISPVGALLGQLHRETPLDRVVDIPEVRVPQHLPLVARPQGIDHR